MWTGCGQQNFGEFQCCSALFLSEKNDIRIQGAYFLFMMIHDEKLVNMDPNPDSLSACFQQVCTGLPKLPGVCWEN